MSQVPSKTDEFLLVMVSDFPSRRIFLAVYELQDKDVLLEIRAHFAVAYVHNSILGSELPWVASHVRRLLETVSQRFPTRLPVYILEFHGSTAGALSFGSRTRVFIFKCRARAFTPLSAHSPNVNRFLIIQ